MARRKLIYEGKAKILYEGPEPGLIVQYYKDEASRGAEESGTITGKGVLNNQISEFLMTRLQECGVPTHFVKRLNMREQLVRDVEIIPVNVVVRNIAAGGESPSPSPPARAGSPPAAGGRRRSSGTKAGREPSPRPPVTSR